jgi:hypothetical protein
MHTTFAIAALLMAAALAIAFASQVRLAQEGEGA